MYYQREKVMAIAKNVAERRYDRIAWLYDFMEKPMERMLFSGLRKELLSPLQGKVIEVGAGTGKNFPYYPEGVELTAIDISARMLAKAAKRAERLGIEVDLRRMDAENLDFPDDYFDYAVATFVFCSVPDPVKGLKELARVVNGDGLILLIEHVRSENRFLGKLMDWLNPVVRVVMGPNINRRTVENVEKAGLEVISVERRGPEIVKKIQARPAGGEKADS
jgi:ubiquinone/menaquinone biosynthesis C-methylase UbiE